LCDKYAPLFKGKPYGSSSSLLIMICGLSANLYCLQVKPGICGMILGLNGQNELQ